MREHRRGCSYRSDSISTSTPSLSNSDVEVLSNDDSVTSEDVSHLSPAALSPVKGGDVRGGEKRWQRRKRTSSHSKTSVAAECAAECVAPVRSYSDTKMSAKWSSGVLVKRPHSAVCNQSAEVEVEEEEGEKVTEEEEEGGVSFRAWSDSSYSSDDEDLTYTDAEMAQLLSLNEHDMYPDVEEEEEEEKGKEDEEEEEENGALRHVGVNGGKISLDEAAKVVGGGGGGGGGGGVSKKKRQKRKNKVSGDLNGKSTPTGAHPHPAHSGQPEPVGLFWDIENCSVPMNKSAFAIATKMRKVFFDGKREAEFMVVCDITKERKTVTDALHKAQVCVWVCRWVGV